ncbi:MAG: polyprenyl synthetase family protein [Candidatus Bathyarchaeota archaeon]|nr:polyprenyl synthetase family protein [Candidatus Bathyarchaeota archaeon]
MNSKSEHMQIVKEIVERRGRAAIEKAHEEILGLTYDGGVISSALKYFAKTTLHRSLPVFPALISLSYEAVGGKNDKTTAIGAALTLIAIAADVHDDIIDKSMTKSGRKTVVGKFGHDVALLAGDALLFHGLILLNRECESLPKKQKEAILNITSEAFLEISNAEAKETFLRKKHDLNPKDCLEIIEQKAVVPEALCKIGGILGNADEITIKALGRYGRALGVVSTIRDEFIDLMEPPELISRMANECPPLPLLYALRNQKIEDEIEALAEGSSFIKKGIVKIVEKILSSAEVHDLKKKLDLEIKSGLQPITFVKNTILKTELTTLLATMIEGL